MFTRTKHWWRFHEPTAYRWVRMLVNAGRLLAGPSLADWAYNRDHVGALLREFAAGELEGLQRFSPAAGFVSTPVDGIGAAFTETGRVCSLLFPHTSFTHQVPYYVSEPGASDANKPLEGSFGGIVRTDAGGGEGDDAGEPTWLWTDAFDHDIGYEERSGLLSLSYTGAGLRIAETTYVYPGSDTLVRDFRVENVGARGFEGSFVYHTRANVTDEDQTFVVWHSHRNRLTGDGGLRWVDREGPYALGVWGRRSDGRRATAATATSTDSEPSTTRAREGRYLDGRLRFPCSLEPGEATTFSVFVGDGNDPVPREPPGAETADERQADARAWWRDWFDDAETPATEGDATYERSLVVLGSVTDPETGSVAAAPNLQPMYYPSWIRDDAFVAVALARAGKHGLAERVLGTFCPAVSEPDGAFRQCYNSRGEFAGVIEFENDQQPLYAWAVSEVYAETGNDEFLERAWPTVRDALEYTMDVVGPDGLLEPSPDVAEYPEHVRQSLWTNTFAYRALLDGADLAEAVDADPDRYRTVAETVGDAVDRHFFDSVDGEGFLVTRGANGGRSTVFLYDAVAVYPTRWAVEYDRVEPLRAELLDRTEVQWRAWVPNTLMAATAFYECDARERADRLIAKMREETTGAGHLKEIPGDDDENRFGSPLAWSHAAFVLAVTKATSTLDADANPSPDADANPSSDADANPSLDTDTNPSFDTDANTSLDTDANTSLDK